MCARCSSTSPKRSRWRHGGGRRSGAGKKIFGVFSGTEERPWGLIFKPDSDQRASLLEDGRFYSPPYFGPSGWLTLDLEAGPVDWNEVRELADASYRQVALKRMLKALDA
jgi:predicted DNA-binding protein (MmcQ/YjbR family)